MKSEERFQKIAPWFWGVVFFNLTTCGGGAQPKKSKFPDGGQIYTPVKVEGGVEETNAQPQPPSPMLNSVRVVSIEPSENEEAALAVESIIAFQNTIRLVDCEKKVASSKLGPGSIVIQFQIGEEGSLSTEPSVVMTTSPSMEKIGECIRNLVGEIDFSGISLSAPTTFHLILKYGS